MPALFQLKDSERDALRRIQENKAQLENLKKELEKAEETITNPSDNIERDSAEREVQRLQQEIEHSKDEIASAENDLASIRKQIEEAELPTPVLTEDRRDDAGQKVTTPINWTKVLGIGAFVILLILATFTTIASMRSANASAQSANASQKASDAIGDSTDSIVGLILGRDALNDKEKAKAILESEPAKKGLLTMTEENRIVLQTVSETMATKVDLQTTNQKVEETSKKIDGFIASAPAMIQQAVEAGIEAKTKGLATTAQVQDIIKKELRNQPRPSTTVTKTVKSKSTPAITVKPTPPASAVVVTPTPSKPTVSVTPVLEPMDELLEKDLGPTPGPSSETKLVVTDDDDLRMLAFGYLRGQDRKASDTELNARLQAMSREEMLEISKKVGEHVGIKKHWWSKKR